MKKEKPKKLKQVITTVKRAEDFDFKVSRVVLSLGTCWGAWMPGKLDVKYFKSQAAMLLACDDTFKRGVLNR